MKINDLQKRGLILSAGVAILTCALLGIYISYISEGANAAGPGPDAQQAMPVTVFTVQESTQPIWTEYAARLVAVDAAEIRPQVSGVIKEIKFDEGQTVKKGDILFVIDPAPYEAAVAQAQADLNAAKSQYDYAQKELARAQNLLKTDAISKTIMDQRQNDALVAKNNIDSTSAKLRQAKINLDYAYVKAPISGRVGRAEITQGNLVSNVNPPLLTTVVANENIYADFDVDERTYLQNVRAGAQGIAAERAVPVRMTIKGDENTVYDGTVHSFDNSINVTTGTIRARALFENKDAALLPGMFATVKLGRAGDSNNILIPQQTISTDQDRKFVYVVDDSNKVVYREVKLGASVDDKQVVIDGLKPGDKIIVDGVMRVRPGMPVAPKEDTVTAAPPVTDAQPAATAAPTTGDKPDDVLKKVEPSKDDSGDKPQDDKSQGDKQ